MKPNLLTSQYRRIKLKIKFNFKKESKAKNIAIKKMRTTFDTKTK